MKCNNLARLFVVLGIMFLAGTATTVAQHTPGSYVVVENAGFTGMFIEGTDGSRHFRGSEVDANAEVCGQMVEGTDGSHRLRGVSGSCNDIHSVNVYPGGESIPIAPDSCVDTQGRERSAGPCRGS